MPIGETRKEDGANVAPLAFTNDDAARVEAAQRKGKRRDRILVVGRKKAVAQKLSEQGVEAAGSKSGGHYKIQARKPERRRSRASLPECDRKSTRPNSRH